MSSPASYFPLPRVDEPISPSDKMSADEFRIAYRVAIKQIQMQIFFDELLAVTGQKTIKALLESLGVDANDEGKISAWYARARGKNIPRSPRAAALRRKVAAAKFELHHPVWRWLSNPDLDPRTVRRLKAQMPGYWHDASALLEEIPNPALTVGSALVKRLSMHRLTYLDALFLFWVERHRAATNTQRRASLNQILWLLPVLYADDPIWTSQQEDRQRWTLSFIDYSLGLYGADDPAIRWAWSDRVSLIFEQQWRQSDYLRKYPEGLRTKLIRRRHLAERWFWRLKKAT